MNSGLCISDEQWGPICAEESRRQASHPCTSEGKGDTHVGQGSPNIQWLHCILIIIFKHSVAVLYFIHRRAMLRFALSKVFYCDQVAEMKGPMLTAGARRTRHLELYPK